MERVREAAPQGASAPSGERRGGPQVAARLRALPPRPAPTGPGGHPARGGSTDPCAIAPRRRLRRTRSTRLPLLPAASSPKRLWSWRVPCTVPLGKISRWKPVRQ